MPSTLFFAQSGGQKLVSGHFFSGSYQLQYGVAIRLDRSAPGLIYLGIPNLSGEAPTFLSGGSLSSGGLADGFPLYPGEGIFVAKSRLISGILTPTLNGPAGSSGGRVWWEPDITVMSLTAREGTGAGSSVSGAVQVSGIVGVSGSVSVLSGRIQQTTSWKTPGAIQVVMQSGTLNLSLSGMMVSGAGGPVFNMSGLNHKMDVSLNIASGFDIIVASGAPIAEVYVVPSFDGTTFPDFASGTVEPGSGYYVGTFRKPPNQFGSGLFLGTITGIPIPPRTFNVQLKVMAGPFRSGGANTLSVSLYDDQQM